MPNSVLSLKKEKKKKTGSADTVLLCLKETCGLFRKPVLNGQHYVQNPVFGSKDHKLTDLGLNVYFEV